MEPDDADADSTATSDPGTEDPWQTGPQRIAPDRFRRIECVGRGSMGTVYRAWDDELGAEVAIKAIHDLGADWVYRLKREFRSIAGLNHPNLVQLYDLFAARESCFFTMEFVKGRDFVSTIQGDSDETRSGRGPREVRILDRFLRAAYQITHAVESLHSAGRIHRDIKPANILIDGEGRVVLLDFDLVAPHETSEPIDFASAAFAGSFAYMAPEEFRGAPASPESDWYSVGAIFYEALTGRRPLAGDALTRLATGRTAEITPLREALDDCPGWLDELVMALLAVDTSERANGGDLRGVLEDRAGVSAHPEPSAPGRAGGAVELVGRQSELDRLHEIRDRNLEAGGAGVVFVQGASGVGKTALMRAFTSAVTEEDGALVLRGRCSPQETVPYRSLDPIVDALSRRFLDQPVPLEIHGAWALIQLFPVFSRIPALAEAARGVNVPDPFETRRLGVAALRTLLLELGRRTPLVIWIDDAQWSDLDSGRLLADLLRPPDPPSLLIVLSTRTNRDAATPLVKAIESLAKDYPQITVHSLPLEPLETDHALALAAKLCHGRELANAIAAESGGSPFLIQEMARHVGSQQGFEGLERFDLRSVVQQRIARLPEDERRILELVALCTEPVDRSLLLRAAELGERGRPVVARLANLSLVHLQDAGTGHHVETYHDRIREIVSSELPSDRAMSHHLRLAETLETQSSTKLEILSHHFFAADRVARAVDYRVRAADEAFGVLAFEHAADLYRSAREWDDRGAEWSRRLHTREARSLANAARLGDAGRGFLAAAHEAPRLQNLELRRNACEHLLAGANLEEGNEALAALLVDLRLPEPRGARRALLATAWRLSSVLLRRFRDHPTGSTDPLEAIRIDTCFAMGKNLVDMDAARGSYFSVTGLALALDSGDRYRIARSLGIVGGLLAIGTGGRLARQGWRMMERADGMAQEIGAAELIGTLSVAAGQVLMLSGRWRDAVDRLVPAVRMLGEDCQGHAFECNIGRGMALRALEEIGTDLAEIGTRAQQLHDAAVTARNRYAETAAVQHLCFVALARDETGEARRLAEHGLSLWPRDENAAFHVQHLYTARAAAQCDLYADQPEESLSRFRGFWPALQRSGLLRVSLAGIDALQLRAQLALNAMERTPEPDGVQKGSLEREILRDARRLERFRRPDARVQSRLLRAGLHAHAGDPARALPILHEAAALAEFGQMPLRAECIRLRTGRLMGGVTGRSMIERSRSQIEAYGIRNPERWAALYAPGIPTST